MNGFGTAAAVLAGNGDEELRRHLGEARTLSRWALGVLVLGLAPVCVWLALAPLASAVVAQAFVKVDLDRRPVQHAEGGMVREVKVRDGQRVTQGEPLLVLGDVSIDAEVNRLNYRVMTELASLARWEAEQLGASNINFPSEVKQSAARDPRLAEQLLKERALFTARRDSMLAQVKLLQGQHGKVQQESESLRAQITQAAESLKFQREELETNRGLLKDGFISPTRVAQLQASVADYAVKQEEKRSDLARAEQRLADTDLRITSLQGEYRQQASEQAKVTAARLSEIQQELRKSTDASTRQVIAAPVSGEVVNLRFTSPGAVVPPRETIADIVPINPRLVIEAHIRTEDVARVQQGQAAEMRFTAFKYRTSKLVPGRVFYVAADRSVDRSTNQPFFVALIEADPGALQQAGDAGKLHAGMPVEVYLRGEERTPLQYLVEPVTQVLRSAGRER